MSQADFSTFDQDQLELPQKVRDFNQKKLPFRFIHDINIKHQKRQNMNTVQELEVLSSEKCCKSAEITPSRTPTLSKFRSYEERTSYSQKVNQQTEDPEIFLNRLKSVARKKLTIQKKQRESEPLQGEGVIKQKDGKVIFGTWLNGELQGEASIVYPNGDIYRGSVKNSLKHGRGRYKFENKQKYQGDFDNDHFTGFGVLYDLHGQILHQGIWKEGQLIQNIY